MVHLRVSCIILVQRKMLENNESSHVYLPLPLIGYSKNVQLAQVLYSFFGK